jgi:ABC-2 type transport system ATP-binding protein
VESIHDQSGEPIIELRGLMKTYGDQIAVNDLNLRIAPGEVFGLLGPNGAGKTTTILMLLGLTEPTAGTARVCGLDPARNPLQVKRRVGYMPDDVGFYEDRTALDNLLFTASLNRIPPGPAFTRAEALLEQVGLSDAAGKKVGAFSRGMRQRLGLADVLIKSPDIVILDEPTLGIDPEGVRELLELISSLSRKEGLTVLLSSHQLHQVQQICDRVGLFVKGRLIACGDIAALSQALDGEGSVTVELETAEWSAELEESLRHLEGVTDLDIGELRRNEAGEYTRTVNVGCAYDITPTIARQAVLSGAELLQFRRKRYGLDDIYHRYFEGGDNREPNRVRT